MSRITWQAMHASESARVVRACVCLCVLMSVCVSVSVSVSVFVCLCVSVSVQGRVTSSLECLVRYTHSAKKIQKMCLQFACSCYVGGRGAACVRRHSCVKKGRPLAVKMEQSLTSASQVPTTVEDMNLELSADFCYLDYNATVRARSALVLARSLIRFAGSNVPTCSPIPYCIASKWMVW